MTPIARSEILNLYDYEIVREARRREVIALKQRRRVSVGRHLTFVFENRGVLIRGPTGWINEMIHAQTIVVFKSR